MSIRIFAIALFAAGLPLAAPSAPAHETATAVLARVRAATLARPLSSILSLRQSGAIAALGLRGRSVEWDDVTHRAFAQRVTGLGMFGGASGWNGTQAWVQDPSGIVRIDGGQSTRLQDIDQAYMDTLAFLRPGADGASVTFAGVRHEGRSAYDIVEVTPPGGSPMDLWVDTRTNLIAKMSGTIGLLSSTTTLSDYRRIEGVEVPFHAVTHASNGNDSALNIAAVEVNVSNVAAKTRIPRSSAHDFAIAGGTATTLPIQILNNHIYLHVMLDGKGPYTFIFDTGGAYIVTPEVAAVLNARSAGGVKISGVGAETESAQFTHVDDLRIGNATIRNQDFLVLPIARSFGVAEGIKIDGMIGYDVPARFLTTVNYAARTLTLAMPGTAAPAGTAVPFFFDQTIPRVPIVVDGIAASAELDTGNRSAFDLFSPFLTAHPKLAAFATTAIGVNGFGVGGPALGKLGRIPTLQIGTLTFDRVVTGFSTQQTGALADPFTAANVGGGLWNRFTLTLDYPHQRIYLEPNARFGTPFSYDRSGLFLIDVNGGVTVLDARAGTPASSVGLRKGDVIVSVDGKAASSYTLAQLRALLSGAPGTHVRLHVRSGATERDVTLTLEDYV